MPEHESDVVLAEVMAETAFFDPNHCLVALSKLLGCANKYAGDSTSSKLTRVVVNHLKIIELLLSNDDLPRAQPHSIALGSLIQAAHDWPGTGLESRRLLKIAGIYASSLALDRHDYSGKLTDQTGGME